MKRPLAGAILSYAAGILLGHFFQPPPVRLWGLALVAGALVLGFRRRRGALLWLLLLLFGWANLVTHTAVISANDLRQLVGTPPALVTVRGVLAEPPRVKMIEREGKTILHTEAVLEVSGLERDNLWQPATGRVAGMTPGTLEARFYPRREIEVTGVIDLPATPLAEGLFDEREYLGNRGIYYQLKTSSPDDWRIVATGPENPPLTQRFQDWSQRTLALGLPEEDDALRLIWAMALGWRTAFTGDVGDPFLRAGTMHLFAIDGLRIALVSGMLVMLLRLVRFPRAVCGLIAIPLIWFYTAATGWEPSAIRASVMMTIIVLGWALNRPGDLLNSLAAAALVILVWDPRQLFAAGFQLSFLVVLVIGLMLPSMIECADRLVQWDPLVPPDSVLAWKRRGRGCLRIFLRLLALSFAAWVGSIPLSARYFHLFSPVSPLANVVAVPLGAGALVSMMGSLVCGGWFPGAAVLFNHSAWFLMAALTRVSEFFSGLPGAYYYVTAPSWPAIGLYYAVLVAACAHGRRVLGHRPARIAVLAGAAGVMAVGVGLWWWSRREFTLTVLPLSGSQTVFVTGPQGHWLINCGNADAVDFTLKPFLRSQGVNRIPRLLLTTGDESSCGGAARLPSLFGVDELFTSAGRFRSTVYRDFAAQFDATPARHQILPPGATAGCWRALYPGPDDDFPRADDKALVLRGQFYQCRVLLLASLGRNGQSALLNRTNDLPADIVVSALPAQGEPLCDALLAAIRPHVVVIADAEYPVTRRAGEALKARLAKTGIPVIYTRTAGAVTLVARQGGWELTAMDGQRIKSGSQRPGDRAN